MKEVHNFSAGPCILPKTVLQQASNAVVDLDGCGLSLIEISHRSKAFVDIMEEARSLVKEMLNLPPHFEVLFLQGGASLGFYISALNFMHSNNRAAYINTGSWASKAIKEANRVGEIDEVASSKDTGFKSIPKEYSVGENIDFLHYTSNNTIFGTQFHQAPEVNVPLIADMSSDIFSKPIEDINRYALIYAGAQKNMGPAGTTLYIVNTEKLPKKEGLPSMLDLQVHIGKDSMFNTPPVFAVYVSLLTLRWLKEKGGVNVIAEENKKKAELMYQTIDQNPMFEGFASKEDRSIMNATFQITQKDLEEEFNQAWTEAGISGIKGHRSVGGYRASMYNALPYDSVNTLAEVMNEFATLKA